MTKLAISLIIILSTCQGCSFISSLKEQLFHNNAQHEPEKQNNEQQQEKQAEPIPVNPQHS